MRFNERVEQAIGEPLMAIDLEVLQVNVGYRCNMACKHCHVQAGAERTEIMTERHIDHMLDILSNSQICTLDITGGAPELNPSFRYLVTEAAIKGIHVIVRTNLTVFFEEGCHDIPDFFRDHNVEIIASLPYYREDLVDRVRGKGVFLACIAALRKLNRLGYGFEKALPLHLVFNPSGAFLPPAQSALEAEYKKHLGRDYAIEFNRLYTFANAPLGRFRSFLVSTGNYDAYMKRLQAAFNPGTLGGIMCRHILNVGWDGRIYDCDFNQMAGLGILSDRPRMVDFSDLSLLSERGIATADHCYACTAGQGST